jgi:hypothetical protein
MQHCRKRNAWIVRQGIAQRQRPVRRQLGDEALGQRLEAVIFIGFTLRLRRSVGVNGSDWSSGDAGRFGDARIMSSVSVGCGRRPVLRIDVAAVDAELPFAVDADERAGVSHSDRARPTALSQ